MANPTGYINGQINWRKNLVGSTVLEGTLSNTATVVNFKDPVILVTWLSKSNETIGTIQFSVNKTLPAGETISYKLKVSAPSKFADATGVSGVRHRSSIRSAEAVDPQICSGL